MPVLPLFLLLLATPIIEIYVLIAVGRQIGALPTVLLVVALALFGAWLFRREGIGTLRRLQETMARGEVPAREIAEGLVVLFAGALLITPGFITDAIGLIILFPPLRHQLANGLVRYLLRHARVATAAAQGSVIEGDFRAEREPGQARIDARRGD